MSDYDDDDHGSGRRSGGSNASTRKNRHRPFASVLMVALLLVPIVVLAFRLITAIDPSVRWLTIWLLAFTFGVVVPLVAIGVGYKVTRRLPFVTWHVAVTIELFAVATSLGVSIGWSKPDTAPWYERLWDGMTIPTAAWVVYLIGSLCLALTWLVYRIDAFRAATGTERGESGISDLLKWPKGAKIRKNTIEGDEFAVTATIDHAGVPVSELRSKLPAIEEHPGFVRGRASIVPDGEHGGRSKIRLVHTDPHSVWRKWPGLSHPGGSYSHPLRTSYYSTGETQWYSFVRTPDGLRSEIAPNFRSPNGTFKGSQGMTRAGKSGEAAIELAEVLSRRNVAVVYVDVAKLLQNASWCLEFCALAAGSRSASGVLFKGLRRLGEYRSRVLGEAGHREFSDDSFEQLGLAWIHIFADEFDVAKQGDDLNWLATKGASLGIRLSFTLPRAHGQAMNTDIRAAIGMWAQFGISQDYDKAFVLSKETMEAGANPEQWKATVPGAHYLDGAPGIDPNKYPIDCRSYETRQDFADLREAVIAARQTFTPADLTPGELEVLGDVAQICRPSVVRAAHQGMDAAPVTPVAAPPQDMQQTIDLSEVDDDGEDDDMFSTGALADAQDAAMPIDTAGILRTLADLGISDRPDPERPIEQLPAGQTGSKLVFDKPRARSPQESVVEFDAALVRMAKRGVREFGNADVIAEMRVVPSESWISKRFAGLCDRGEHVTPPGLTIERTEGRGRYLLTYLAGVPVGADTHSE